VEEIVISTIKDAEEIELLRNRQSFDYTYDNATIDLLKKNFLLDDSLYLIAKKGTEFAAFCSMDRDWWEDSYFFIREILVDSNFQKLGLGKELIERCLQHAKKKQAMGVICVLASIIFGLGNKSQMQPVYLYIKMEPSPGFDALRTISSDSLCSSQALATRDPGLTMNSMYST
jgi:GNAT superfamily N-acetyltransferase